MRELCSGPTGESFVILFLFIYLIIGISIGSILYTFISFCKWLYKKIK